MAAIVTPVPSGRAIVAALLWCLLAMPSVRELLEARMALHMAVQLPLLAAVGWLLATALPSAVTKPLQSCNEHGIAGTVVAVLVALHWMLPRMLDAALAGGGVEAVKFVSLPLLVGLPLSLSWGRLNSVGRGFVLANLLSMLAVLGWLYLAAPVRVCSFYLIDQQAVLGRTLLGIAAAVGAVLLLRLLFIGQPSATDDPRSAPSWEAPHVRANH